MRVRKEDFLAEVGLSVLAVNVGAENGVGLVQIFLIQNTAMSACQLDEHFGVEMLGAAGA